MWHVPGRREMHTYEVLMGIAEVAALKLQHRWGDNTETHFKEIKWDDVKCIWLGTYTSGGLLWAS